MGVKGHAWRPDLRESCRTGSCEHPLPELYRQMPSRGSYFLASNFSVHSTLAPSWPDCAQGDRETTGYIPQYLPAIPTAGKHWALRCETAIIKRLRQVFGATLA